jgi:hypothetical protein
MKKIIIIGSILAVLGIQFGCETNQKGSDLQEQQEPDIDLPLKTPPEHGGNSGNK